MSSRTLLEALASAIHGTDNTDTRRLEAEFNGSFGDYVRASVEVESVNGKDPSDIQCPTSLATSKTNETGFKGPQTTGSRGNAEAQALGKLIVLNETCDSEDSKKIKNRLTSLWTIWQRTSPRRKRRRVVVLRRNPQRSHNSLPPQSRLQPHPHRMTPAWMAPQQPTKQNSVTMSQTLSQMTHQTYPTDGTKGYVS